MKIYMKRIEEEIEKRSRFQLELSFKKQLIILLKTLDSNEIENITEYFLKLDWDVGSLNCLEILQESRILSMSEYIFRQSSEESEHIQNVLSDLFESHFQLLANFLTNSFYNSSNQNKLKFIIEDSLKLLLTDLQTNPNIINTNYLNELKNMLNDQVYSKFKYLHVRILMDSSFIASKNAFRKIETWKNEIISLQKSTYFEILEELIINEDVFLQNILKLSTESDFKGWKYFVIFLFICCQKSSATFNATIKNHLKDLFKALVKGNIDNLLILFLTARSALPLESNTSNSNANLYSAWYKNTFGDMKYTVTTEEFKNIMVILEDLINLDMDLKYLEIHAGISISPPAHCNDIILKYKSKCRIKISSLKRIDPNESVTIDDDL